MQQTVMFVAYIFEVNILKKKIVAIYIRVSTDAQAEEGYSIDAQKEQLAAYCISKGIKEYEFYIDGGWSGSNINRPEIQRLINDVKSGKISCVIVYKLDRLSRSQKDTLYLIEDVFNPNGVDFVSLNESMDTSTPMGRLMLGILSAFAQLERENIRLRTRMGMKERVKSGLWMGGGVVPFGYNYDKGQGILVPNDDAEKVRQVYQLYIEGKAPQDISNMLGLKYDKLVTQILTRKTNYGIIEYNGEEYQGKHEPLISKETYDVAMKCMSERSRVRSNDSEYLLTGLLYCGKCGAKMRYQKWGKRGCKICCYSQQKSKPYLIKDENCTQEKVWADEVEKEVVSNVLKIAGNYDADNKKDNLISKDHISILKEEQQILNRKIKKLYDLYASTDEDNEQLLQSISDLKKDLQMINKKIDIEEKTTLRNLKREERNSIYVTVNSVWDDLSIKQKKIIIRKLVKKIEINDENIRIDFDL